MVAKPTTISWGGNVVIKRDVGEVKLNPHNRFKCEVVEYKSSQLFNRYDKAVKLSKDGQEITLDLSTLQVIIDWALLER